MWPTVECGSLKLGYYCKRYWLDSLLAACNCVSDDKVVIVTVTTRLILKRQPPKPSTHSCAKYRLSIGKINALPTWVSPWNCNCFQLKYMYLSLLRHVSLCDWQVSITAQTWCSLATATPRSTRKTLHKPGRNARMAATTSITDLPLNAKVNLSLSTAFFRREG